MSVRPSRLLLTLSLLTLFAVPSTQAQQLPGAGDAIRNIERQPLVLPPRQQLDLNLPDESSAPVSANGGRLAVVAFHFSGNSVIDSETLAVMLTDLTGRELSLAELQGGARRISRLYRERGYPLARAWLPRQAIAEGVVRIEVIEGRFGDVRIDNQADLRASALAPLAELKPGEVVQAARLERALLLTRDLAGVDVKSTLQPGASLGTTDLLVETSPSTWLKGSIEVDNHGNHYTGENRLGLGLELGNMLGLGDRLNLRILGSDEHQLYGRVSWQGALGPWGTQLGASHAQMRYTLGKDFAVLDATGFAHITSVWTMQPLLRARDASLYATMQFDNKRLQDDIALYASQNSKHTKVLSATLSGNGSDDWFGGGQSSFSLSWSLGRLNLEDASTLVQDATTARTQGNFQKVNASLVRLQRLSSMLSLYGQIGGQWADRNLDSSEKMVLGGADGVRAYPQGEAAGDQGLLAQLELRYALTAGWQLAAFIDHGQVRINEVPWTASNNQRNLSGAGIGVNWTDGYWRVQASLAWKLSDEAATSGPERTPSFWVQVARGF